MAFSTEQGCGYAGNHQYPGTDSTAGNESRSSFSWHTLMLIVMVRRPRAHSDVDADADVDSDADADVDPEALCV